MAPNAGDRVAQRIPNLLTLFFSISLVLGFSSLATYFDWRTAPSFSIREWPDVLVLLSFVVTLYFVVSVWLAFSVLLERNPYKLSFGRFYFDAARFGLMFAILMWSFLAGQPAHFQYYVFGLAFWHGMMAAWYIGQMRASTDSVRQERKRDLYTHGLTSLLYLVLAAVYYAAVARQWTDGQSQWLYIGLTLLTLAIVSLLTTRRLSELKARVLLES